MQKYFNVFLVFISLFLTFGNNTCEKIQSCHILQQKISQLACSRTINYDCSVYGIQETAKKLLNSQNIQQTKPKKPLISLDTKYIPQNIKTAFECILNIHNDQPYIQKSNLKISYILKNDIFTRAP